MSANEEERNDVNRSVETAGQVEPVEKSESASKVRSVIGSGVTVIGNLESAGEVEVKGAIKGDIKCRSVLVGDRARVAGGVAAEDVVVLGQVEGSIRGEFVMLKSGSRVGADLYYNSLVVHQGAVFDGASKHMPAPLAQVETASPIEQQNARVAGYQGSSNKSA